MFAPALVSIALPCKMKHPRWWVLSFFVISYQKAGDWISVLHFTNRQRTNATTEHLAQAAEVWFLLFVAGCPTEPTAIVAKRND